MEENRSKNRFSWGPKMRFTAGFLVAAILFSLGANAAVGIRIDAGDKKDAAKNYLVENTDYVNDGTLDRVGEKVKTLSEPTQLEDYYRKAGTQIAETDYEGAHESIVKCLELFPGGDDALEIDLLMKKGCLEVLLERDEEAIASLDTALETDPEQADAYLVKAQIYARQEDSEQLADSLAAYLELQPNDLEVRQLLAQAMFSQSDYSGAAAQYEQVISQAPPETDTSQTEYLYALTSIQIGDFATAEKALIHARKADKTLEGVDYYIGMCQMAQGDYKNAANNMTAAIKQNSMLQLSQYSRGVCRLMDENQYEAALEDLKQAAEYSGPDADRSIAKQAQSLLDELAAAEAEAQRIAEEEAARLEAEAEAARKAAEEAAKEAAEWDDITSAPDAAAASEAEAETPQITSKAENDREEPAQDLPNQQIGDALTEEFPSAET